MLKKLFATYWSICCATAFTFSLNCDGQVGPSQLTFGPVAEIGAVYSPDGRFIAFEYFHAARPTVPSIWVMPADGDFADAKALLDDGHFNGAPGWSPDGNWISFKSNRNTGGSQIFKISTKTGEIVQLTNLRDNAPIGGSTSWSGQNKIAFEVDGDIFSVSSKGTKVEILLSVSSLDESWFPSDFAWSSDGTKMAFTCQKTLDNSDPDKQKSSICVGDAKTGSWKEVTRGPSDSHPAWNGNDRILFSRLTSPSSAQICLLQLKTGEVTKQTADFVDVFPAAHPAGRVLLFSRAARFTPTDLQAFRGFHVWRQILPRFPVVPCSQ